MRWRSFCELIDEIFLPFLFERFEVMMIALHDVFDGSTLIDFFFDPTISDEFIKAACLKELKVFWI